MKRIFLCFPIAKECHVKRPVTPVMHNLVHEKKQKNFQPGTLSHTLQNILPSAQGQDESHITVRKMDIVEYKQNTYRQQNQIASIQHIINM